MPRAKTIPERESLVNLKDRVEGEGGNAPQRQRCRQTPLLQSPLNLLQRQASPDMECRGRAPPAALLKSERSGGCSTTFLLGWPGPVLMAAALSRSLAKVFKY